MEIVAELDYESFLEASASSRVMATLVYTPTCGTCLMAKKIMGVMSEALSGIDFYQINLNRCEKLAAEYGILSVPCLLIHKEGRFRESAYLFGAAGLYEQLSQYLDS